MKRTVLFVSILAVTLGWGLSPQWVHAGTCVRICPEAHTDTPSGRTLYGFTIIQGSATCTQDQTNFCNTISGTPFCPSVPGSSPATLAQARRFCERDPAFYQAPEGTPSWCADLLAGRFLERPESGGGRLMSEQKCRLPATETPAPAASTTPRTGGVPATQLTPSIPQLAVPIPGVTITAPTQNSDGTISVPYLAQYISGIYRYLLGISTIVAIIMVIYGGFLYLLASTGLQVASGKTIIQDALIGLVVLYGSYFILWNVNPDLVSLRPITLRSVRSVALEMSGEGVANEINPDGAPSGSSTSCALHFNQGSAPWGSMTYGNNGSLVVGGTETLRPCSNGTEAGDDAVQCQSTFAQSACGVTSLASVLGFYNLQIAIPSRVPTPGASMHPIDPIDTAIYTVLSGGRRVKNGPGRNFFENFERHFPQFQQQSVSDAIAVQKAREGKPVIIACSNISLYTDEAATQPVSRTENTEMYRGGGHFMVLKGTVNDQILRVHDVGNSRSRTMRVADFNAHCSGRLITPKANAPREATVTWGTGAQAVQVQMRLPAGGATNQCHMTGGATASAGGGQPCAAGSGLSCYSFTYKPNNNMVVNGPDRDHGPQCAPSTPIWPENSARLLYPTRLQGQQNVQVHAFIFLHGNNNQCNPPNSAPYIHTWLPAALREHTDKNIVVITPHHNGDNQGALNITEFYATAQRALQAALPGARVADVVIGGSSAATFNPQSSLGRAMRAWPGTPTLRAIIAYDGYAGENLTSSNFIPPSGVALYLNPDMNGMGSGPTPPRSDGKTRAVLVRESWRLQSVNCPVCPGVGAYECFGPGPGRTGYQRNGAEIMSFQTQSGGHGPNVVPMTKIAFCALYHAASSQ